MANNPGIRAPRGRSLRCKGWQQEAALRMLMNNLDEEIAERPDELVVYGGSGKAARNWDCYHAIVRSLQSLENDQTLLIQSGKPVGVFRTHEYSPRVLNALLNTASGASWVSFHHGGGVGIGYSLHAGQVTVADGSEEMGRRIERVLNNDPGIGVARHADAGYVEARDFARRRGIEIPM